MLCLFFDLMVSDKKCWGFCCLSIFVLNYVMIHVEMGFSFYCVPGYLGFVEVENSENWDPFSFGFFLCLV